MTIEEIIKQDKNLLTKKAYLGHITDLMKQCIAMGELATEGSAYKALLALRQALVAKEALPCELSYSGEFSADDSLTRIVCDIREFKCKIDPQDADYVRTMTKYEVVFQYQGGLGLLLLRFKDDTEHHMEFQLPISI